MSLEQLYHNVRVIEKKLKEAPSWEVQQKLMKQYRVIMTHIQCIEKDTARYYTSISNYKLNQN